MISKDLHLAVSILDEEGIIGLPTETVYGLAGNIYSEKAIKEIYKIKERPINNPLIVHIKSINDINTVATDIPEIAIKLAQKFWPGPLTLLLKKKSTVPHFVTANKSTVAVRVPNHPTALALLNLLHFPLAAPSANPFKKISPTKAQHVEDYFKNKIKLVLNGGACKTGVESTIIGFKNNKVIVYRLGGISIEDIKCITNDVVFFTKNEINPEAPGMFLKHYAPNTKLIVTNNISETLKQYEHTKIGLLFFNKTINNLPTNCIQKVLSPDKNLAEAASNLYDTLHEFDKLNLEIIIAEKFPEIGLGSVINDKLTRASHIDEL